MRFNLKNICYIFVFLLTLYCVSCKIRTEYGVVLNKNAFKVRGSKIIFIKKDTVDKGVLYLNNRFDSKRFSGTHFRFLSLLYLNSPFKVDSVDSSVFKERFSCNTLFVECDSNSINKLIPFYDKIKFNLTELDELIISGDSQSTIYYLSKLLYKKFNKVKSLVLLGNFTKFNLNDEIYRKTENLFINLKGNVVLEDALISSEINSLCINFQSFNNIKNVNVLSKMDSLRSIYIYDYGRSKSINLNFLKQLKHIEKIEFKLYTPYLGCSKCEEISKICTNCVFR